MERDHEFRYPITTLAGSTIKNIRKLQGNYTIEPKYRLKFYRSAATAAILEFFGGIERLIWDQRIRKHKMVKPPVFIIGFWRSGTTLLHNLLCLDPDAAYTTTFQTVFPHLVLTQSWWLKPLTNRFLPLRRPYDNVRMDMDYPQEEDFGMMNIQPVTIYKFFLFPAEFDRIIEEELFTGNLSPEKLNQWKKAYRSMIAKAMYNTGGTRYIGKNPCHLTRTGLLKEMFPDAKFIFIHRHPYEVIESLYRFILTIFPGVQLQDVPADFSRESVAILYSRIMRAYLHDREKIPPQDLISIKMDDFLGDIGGQMEMIYEKFRLGDFEKVRPKISEFISKFPRPEHPYHAPDPDTIRLVELYASDVMKKLGYNGR